MNTTRVLALLPLLIVSAHCFSWDIVAVDDKRLEFYYDGELTHTEDIPSAHDITSVTNDPVNDRVLFIELYHKNISIYSYDLTTRKIQTVLIKPASSDSYYQKNLDLDPVTQLLFWVEFDSIYSLSLKPASSNEAVGANLLVKTDSFIADIAIDSCGGYIYWVTESHQIERAAFDGSERQVIIVREVYEINFLAIDQETQTIYWLEQPVRNTYYIQSADMYGKNIKTFYFIGSEIIGTSLTISKDFIYWKSYNKRAFLRVPKNQKHSVAPTIYVKSGRDCWGCQETAAKYTIEDQTLVNKSCEARKEMEKRHRSLCHNYCFQGNCSVDAEEHPRCNCNHGYSGERCEVYACHKHCWNDGVCSLSEKEEPVCRCSADYGGDRCEFPAVLIKCIQTVSMLREMLSADTPSLTLNKAVKSTCAATVA